MKKTIDALAEQLRNYSDLRFAKESGFASRDISELIQIGDYPFFNVTYALTDELYERFDDFSQDEMERHNLPMSIQYATRAVEKNVAVLGDNNNVGILDFGDFIWKAVKFDRTLGGVVSGIKRPLLMTITPFEILPEEPGIFKEAREMIITFYRDQEA